MIAIRNTFLVLISVIWMSCVPVMAQAVDEIDATRQASDGVFAWFKSLQAHAADLVDSAERHQLIQKLKDLRKDLYDLEQDKNFFLDELARNQLDHYQLNRAVNDFNKSILTVRAGVRDVGLSLREQFQKGGLEVERVLRSAVSNRKGWVERFRVSISTGSPIDPGSHILEGRKAVEALRNASVELTKLIAKLEEK